MLIPVLHAFALGVVTTTKPKDRQRVYQAEVPAAGGKITRRLTVYPGERNHLPRAEDLEVFLALVAVARDQGLKRNFTASRYEIMRRMGWNGSIRRRRLTDSLLRWRATSFVYEEEAENADGSSSIQKSPRFTILVPNLTKNESAFAWHDLTLRSLQQQPWPNLDIGRVLGVKRPTSRQLMLFLEGEPGGAEVTVDLQQLAAEHLGFARHVIVSDLKKYVRICIEDLKAIGYLRDIPSAECFRKRGPKQWDVLLQKVQPEQSNQQASPGYDKAREVHST